MEITPLPPVILPAVTQEAAKSLPAIQAQAAAPLIQQAVASSPKADGGNKTRSNKDRAKGGDKKDTNTVDRSTGHSLNLKV